MISKRKEQDKYSGVVLRGDQLGRTIGFPTINLDAGILSSHMQQGVYAALVLYQKHWYKGALYFGPRKVLQEEHLVLEIHLLHFSKEIYGETITFTVGMYIRGVEDFDDMVALQKQLKKDIREVEKALSDEC